MSELSLRQHWIEKTAFRILSEHSNIYFESSIGWVIFALMKTKHLILRGFIFFASLCLTLPAAWGKIHHLKIPSMALADSNRVIIATPSNFEQHRPAKYPFIVMLHGWSGDETQWKKDADLQILSDKYDILLILPDGGYDGWWVDSEVSPGRNYDTHIRQELKIWAVTNFNGATNASQHGVLGLSMGGFGAINQAIKYPDDYAAAASLSGVMDVTRHTDNWHLSNALGLYADDPKRWERNNPLHIAQKKAPRHAPDMILICGRDDFTFEENQDMAAILKKSGYASQVQWEAGTHSHTFWKTHVGSAVAFIVSHFKE